MDYSSAYGTDPSLAILSAGFWVTYAFVFLGIYAFQLICMWKVFTKAGVEGWKAIIPVYNYWVMAEFVGKPGWWGLVASLGAIVPFVGWIAAIIFTVLLYIELAKSFGQSTAFAIGLVLLGMIFYAILAFGKAEYIGPGGVAKAVPAAGPTEVQ